MALTDKAHELIQAHFESDSIPLNLAVDASCGNGHDTLFLAKLGFKNIIGFDIQAEAIDNTKKRLLDARIKNIRIIQDGHENIDAYIEQKIDCVIFNLGYLPNTDKSVTTKAKTTLSALNYCLSSLSQNGLISLMCYPGHPAGLEESIAIKIWLAGLDDCWNISTHLSNSPKPTAPILYLLRKA